MAFSGSKVISQTVSVITGRLGTLVGVWAAFFVIQIVLFLVMGGMMGGAVFGSLMAGGTMMEGGGPDAFAGLSAGLIAGLFVLYLVYMVVGAASAAALSAAASPLIRPSAGDAIGIGFRSAPTLIGVILLVLVAYMLGAVVFGILVALMAALSEYLAAAAAFVILPAVVWAACRLSVIFPVIAVDRVTGPVAAVRRAWGLTRGHALKILAIFVVFAVVAAILFGVIVALFGGSVAGMAGLGAMPSMGMLAGAGLLFVIVSILLGITAAALMSAIHGELAGGGERLAETFG
ncbi:MAG TPA: hypothetical protein PKD92_01485 [Novosphingobium sp.]|nr:hypothetical protein [Novosphingobium sp.]